MKSKNVLLSTLATFCFGFMFGQTVYLLPTTEWSRVSSTQNQKFDALLSIEKQKIQEIFNVSVNFNVGQNAANVNKVLVSFDCPTQNCDGEIWLGSQLLDTYLDNSKGANLHTVAHEAAHVVQQKSGVSLKVNERELHVNYLTGYYIGMLGNVSEKELDNFIQNYYSKMDASILRMSASERSCAFKEGFKTAKEKKRNLEQTIQHGVAFVSTRSVCK